MPNILKNNTLEQLFFKHKVDLWGLRLLRRNRNRATRKIINTFEFKLRSNLIRHMRRLNIYYDFVPMAPMIPWKNPKPKWYRNIVKRNRAVHNYHLSQENPDLFLSNNDIIKGVEQDAHNEQKKEKLKEIFFRALLINYTPINNRLKNYRGGDYQLLEWQNSMMRKILIKLPTYLYKINFRLYYSINKKKPWIYKPSLAYYNKRRLLEAKYYYCFNSLNALKGFLRNKRWEYFRLGVCLGLEGILLNLLFRTNLFPTTRYAYNLLKLGAVFVNDESTNDPYKTLRLNDSFSISPNFIKLLFKLLIKRLKKRLILVNIPNYISYNYRIMHFAIWRMPNRIERNHVPRYPFLIDRDYDTNIKPFSKKKFLDQEEFSKFYTNRYSSRYFKTS